MLSRYHAWYFYTVFIFLSVKLRLLSSSGIEKITEQETAHPSLQQLSQLTGAAVAANGALENITVSHEIEERATALVQGEEDDEDNSSEVADKEFVDQGAFHSEPVIVDVSGTHIKVFPKNGTFFYSYSHFHSFAISF